MPRLMLECAVRAALIALGTAAVVGLLRIKSAGARHAAWTGVVTLMLLLPVWTRWGPRASLPLLPARPMPVAAMPTMLAIPVVPATSVHAPAPAVPRANWNWPAIVYVAGVFILLARLVLGTLRAHALTSVMCAAPVTVGCLRPRVILPADWPDWPQAQLDAVLTHEGEHVRRRDPLVQWLALLNRAIFWFHPLAWWLERHLSALSEEACDAAVLARGHDPHQYTGYLLDLARSVGRSGARIKAVGMAMPGSSLPRRVRRILSCPPAPRLTRRRAFCLAAACVSMSALFAAANVDRQPFVPDPPPPASPPAAPISQSVPSAPAPDPQPPQPPRQSRLTALYFDLDGSLPDMQARANASAIALVQQIQPNALVSIMTFRNGAVKVIEDFTADHNRLIASIGKLENNPTADPGTLNGLLAATKMLGVLHEKKSLIYFAMPPLRVSVSPDELRTVVDAAQQASVALFPIDVTGFVAGAQAGAVIQPGDGLTITLEFKRAHLGGGRVILRADARAEYERINAPFESHIFTVQPDGTVSVPDLGEVQAAGLTIDQLESTLGPALAARLGTPKMPITAVIVEKK